MPRSTLLAVLPLLAAAACATTPPPPPPPTSVVVTAPAAEVRQRLEQAMRGLGLGTEATATGFAADFRGGVAQPWSDCPRILVEDRTEEVTRSDWASPQAREGTVTVSAAEAAAGQTSVTVAARFAATYTDRYRNLPVEGRCRSTGELERALLGAAQGSG